MVCLNILSVCLSIEIRKKIKQTNLRRIWIGEKQKNSMKRESRRNKKIKESISKKKSWFFLSRLTWKKNAKTKKQNSIDWSKLFNLFPQNSTLIHYCLIWTLTQIFQTSKDWKKKSNFDEFVLFCLFCRKLSLLWIFRSSSLSSLRWG